MDEKNIIGESLETIKKKSQEAFDREFFTSLDGKPILKEFEEIYNMFLKSYDNTKESVEVGFEPAGDLEENTPVEVSKEPVPTFEPSEVELSSVFAPAGDLPKTAEGFEPAGDLEELGSPKNDQPSEVELPSAFAPAGDLPKTTGGFEPAGDLSGAAPEVEVASPFSPASDLPVVDLSQASSLFEPAGNLSEIVPGEAPSLPVIDDSTFHITKESISQDLPVSDVTNQSYETPAMSDAQIKASQELIDAVPSAPEDDLADVIAAEINRKYADYDSHKEDEDYKPMTDEEIKISQEKIAGIGKKVVKKEQYAWKDKFKGKVAKLRGILYKEMMRNHTQSYMKICQMIANFRVNYHNISIEDADKGLEAIDRVISESGDLSFEEKKRLYRKLTRLVKAVERINIQKGKEANAAPSVGM